MDIVAEEAVVSRYDVGANLLECVTLVRVSRCVIDRAGEVVLGQLGATRRRLVPTAPATAASPSPAPFAATVGVTAVGFCRLRTDVRARCGNRVVRCGHQ